MNTYPADEQRLSDVERGRCFTAVLPVPDGNSLSAGDIILFALAEIRSGGDPLFVKGGDSVQVALTEVTNLDTIDHASGLALFRLSWTPPCQPGSQEAPRRLARPRRLKAGAVEPR